MIFDSKPRFGGVPIGEDLQEVVDSFYIEIINPRASTLKSVVRNHIGNIRSAQRRGLTLQEIARVITLGGRPILASTLRKYLQLISNQRVKRKRRPTNTRRASSSMARRSLKAKRRLRYGRHG